jgi:hypothetical protein
MCFLYGLIYFSKNYFIFENKKNTIMGVGGILVWTIGFLVLMAIAIVIKEH